MTHIVVTPAEEDEVIVAGAVGASQPESAAEPEPERGPLPAVESSESAGTDSEPVIAKNSQGDYRETTLDDLDSSPMPFAQRVVIVAAVVCIIGALVYYFVAMR